MIASIKSPAAAIGRWIQQIVDDRRRYRVISRSKLFDRQYYLSSNPDLSGHSDPLRHYIEIGWRERRDPSLRFSVSYYLMRNPDVEASGIDPLLHYIDHGIEEGRPPLPAADDDYMLLRGRPDLFDAEYYRLKNSDVRNANVDPLAHFLRYGRAERRRPSVMFDLDHYLESNSDLLDSEVNPLVHYLRYGEREGRTPNSGNCLYSRYTEPAALDREWLDRATPPPREASAYIVDVVIPVYGQAAMTLSCIHSLLNAKQRTNYEIVVIDDAGPDQDLRAVLRTLARRSVITLLENRTNLGFPESANVGMNLHRDRDVILLNSDTMAYGDWIDRLVDVAKSQARVGTITPLSNNATICSYPKWNQDNDISFELSDAELDSLAAKVNRGRTVELPTGVGSCLFVTRGCLGDIGLFDSRSFGKGYGEEVDFCLRARDAGWNNLLAGNVFIRHFGSMSFGTQTHDKREKGHRLLLKMHSRYKQDLERHTRLNPAKEIRARLDLARVSLAAGVRAKPIIFITHDIGGGTERHVHDLRTALSQGGIGSHVFRFDRGRSGMLRLDTTEVVDACNLPQFDLNADQASFIQMLRDLDAGHIHVHHFWGARDFSWTAIASTARALSLQYDVTLHDYYTICPRVNLLYGDGTYCGQQEDAVCDRCVAASGSEAGVVSVGKWRAQNLAFLEGARKVFVPSEDVARRLTKYSRKLAICVRPHWLGDQPKPVRAAGGPVKRLLLIGAINQAKGSRVLKAVAEHALQSGAGLEFVVLGVTDIDTELEALPNVRIEGRYQEHELSERVAAAGCDAFWFPSVWPETFSYTFNFASKSGLFPIAFDIGAPAQVIRDTGWGALMPLAMSEDADGIVRFLATLSIPASRHHIRHDAKYPSILKDYYAF